MKRKVTTYGGYFEEGVSKFKLRKSNYHFVISTERSDEKSLVLMLRSLPSVRDDMTL